MKKQLLFILGAAAISFSTIAQERDPNLIPCATYDAMEEGFKKDPNLKTKFNLIQSQMELDYITLLNKNNTGSKVAAPVYTVPVVFHIMGPQNIADQTFVDLLSYINNDYSKGGSDVGTISPTFASLYVDAEIRFAIAKKDPVGNCTNGVIRHDNESMYWSQSAPAYNYSGTGTNRWPTNKYLNIYIVDCISSMTYSCPTTSGAFIGGYTYLPGSAPANGDAIVMLRNQLALGNPTDSRTLSHEIGHWLNLAHTFGNNNCTGTSCGDDGVTDTPPTQCHFSTCPASVGSSTCAGAGGNSNVENIMDYSSCPKMFTQGQVTRMRAALTSGTAGRNNLWTATNLLATGITPGYTCTPVADFEANKLANCANNTFTYTSISHVGDSGGGVSWTFQGGNPATSTATSQAVTYATPGTYSVSLTATNTVGTNTMNKTSYVAVLNGTVGATAPILEQFEGAALPSTITVINRNAGSITWTQKTTSGANSTAKSIHMNNFPATNIGGHIDIFETPVYNFSSTSGIIFSYYYAYAKRAATQNDSMKIQYSLDCGGTWSNVLGIPSTSQMATASGGTLATAFTPTSAQWIFKSITSSLLAALNNKPSVKFRFYFKADPTKTTANNMYIDQINITGNIATGITELEKSMELSIYPNPTPSSATLDFNISEDERAKITVVDMMGRVLEENVKTSDSNGHVNYTINRNGSLAPGIYIVNIDVNNQRVSKKIIIE